MNIYIVDLIGSHSGTHFYNTSFRDILLSRYQNVRIISNYNDPENDTIAILKNYYRGCAFIKALNMVKSIFSFFFFVMKNRTNCFIFQSFGNAYEIFFVLILIFTRKTIIDVHEIVSLISRNSFQSRYRLFTSGIIYRYLIDAVILHSERSDSLLNDLVYRKPRLVIPHFSYRIKNNASEDTISEEVKSLISGNRMNILFFGQMRISKGIDIVVALAKKISGSHYCEKMNLIIAGSDSKHLIGEIISPGQLKQMKAVSVLLRFISDSELIYLFSHTDFVLLPYKQISQSGVLEMAIQFKKPMVTSSISYFKSVLDRFHSFGIIADPTDTDVLFNIFRYLVTDENYKKQHFYNDSDLANFNTYKNPEGFLSELENIISGTGN